MQMQVVDLRNLIVLARKGMGAFGESISAEEAKAAWTAIGNAETFLVDFEKQIAEKQESSQNVVSQDNAEGTQSELHVVNLDSSDTVG